MVIGPPVGPMGFFRCRVDPRKTRSLIFLCDCTCVA